MAEILPTWNERPTDLSNLLNPALIGLILRQATEEYRLTRSRGMPFELAFIIVPFALHGSTRSLLPKTKATMFQSWYLEHKSTLQGFPQRAKELVPFVREGISFSAARQMLSFEDGDRIIPGTAHIRLNYFLRDSTDEVQEVCRKAKFLGRWMSEAGESSTIFALLGIRP